MISVHKVIVFYALILSKTLKSFRLLQFGGWVSPKCLDGRCLLNGKIGGEVFKSLQSGLPYYSVLE